MAIGTIEKGKREATSPSLSRQTDLEQGQPAPRCFRSGKQKPQDPGGCRVLSDLTAHVIRRLE
jgi:hypothetical protein